jgi:hypothetical protein
MPGPKYRNRRSPALSGPVNFDTCLMTALRALSCQHLEQIHFCYAEPNKTFCKAKKDSMRSAPMQVSGEATMRWRTPGLVLLAHDLKVLFTLLIRVTKKLYAPRR